ncbi:MAG: hypothetical protein FD131_2949 [Rhodocyclaceae bacterium]|nr:MAG: hypothetical protein FD131_2949 [Rhodocyclaceae bacterium]
MIDSRLPQPEALPVRLTLLVPELIWPEPNDQLTLGKLAAPGFEWLAAHAEFSRQPRRAFEHSLADNFGLTDAPFGALRLLGEAGEKQVSECNWLCADPVHLRFHHERIVLADAGAFELELEEAQAITASLNSEFADIGRFHVATARRWYLQLNSTVNEKFAPISTIAGRRLDSDLTDKNGRLNRWLNEVQMFLHGHPINERRQAEGKPAVNSVWLWGGGPLSAVCSDNPLATGLALAAGIEAPPCPASLSALLADSAPNDNPLVVLDNLLPPVLYENSDDWRNAFAALERDWFVPLRTALGGKIESLTIVAPTIYGQLTWTLHGKDRWKFWRKSRPLQTIAKDLAETPAEGTTP